MAKKSYISKGSSIIFLISSDESFHIGPSSKGISYSQYIQRLVKDLRKMKHFGHVKLKLLYIKYSNSFCYFVFEFDLQ